MSDGLQMKYFVLKPRPKSADDPYANASHAAMFAYADMIEEHNPDLASELRQWAGIEVGALVHFPRRPKSEGKTDD